MGIGLHRRGGGWPSASASASATSCSFVLCQPRPAIKPKPKKSSEQLKRAADQLDEALEGSPVKKKKSKTNLDEQTINVPNPVIALPDISVPSPEYIALYEPEAALRLTKASNTINFAIDKINYYADLLSVFDNNHDDSAIALAVRTNAKIEKWDNYRENVQKSMDVLLKVAPKKRGSALLDTQTAEGFVSSSGELPIPFFPGSRPSVLIWAFFPFFLSPYWCHALTRLSSPYLFRI